MYNLLIILAHHNFSMNNINALILHIYMYNLYIILTHYKFSMNIINVPKLTHINHLNWSIKKNR